ncbi:MAG: NADH-quinone oxidoreductase subunit NuoK [Candidatus Limnocylindria bacterium]
MSGPPLEAYLVLGALLFGAGVWGILTQRSAVMVLMSIEIIMNAALLTIVAAWRFVAPADASGQVFFIIGVTIGAAEMAAGLGIALLVYRQNRTQQIDAFHELRR